MASKPVPSLEEMMAADLSREAKAKAARAPKATKPTSKAVRSTKTADVVKLIPPQTEAAITPTPQEIDKVTVYLPRPVYRFIKQTALELEKRPHDLLMQGIELLLEQHGKSLKDFGSK